MAKRVLVISLATCLVVLFSFGCSSDDSTSSNNGNGTGDGTGLPDFSNMVVTIPAAMQSAANTNAGAANAVGLITMANTFSAYAFWMVPGGTQKTVATQAGSPYTWTVGDLTITMTVTEIDSDIHWTVTLDGTDGQETYTNFVLMSGQSESDGSSGSLSLFAPQSGNQEVFSWSWQTSQSGIFSIDYFIPDGGIAVTVEINPDGTGAVIHRVVTNTVYTATWISNGSGAYSYYDAQGTVIDSGTW